MEQRDHTADYTIMAAIPTPTSTSADASITTDITHENKDDGGDDDDDELKLKAETAAKIEAEVKEDMAALTESEVDFYVKCLTSGSLPDDAFKIYFEGSIARFILNSPELQYNAVIADLTYVPLATKQWLAEREKCTYHGGCKLHTIAMKIAEHDFKKDTRGTASGGAVLSANEVYSNFLRHMKHLAASMDWRNYGAAVISIGAFDSNVEKGGDDDDDEGVSHSMEIRFTAQGKASVKWRLEQITSNLSLLDLNCLHKFDERDKRKREAVATAAAAGGTSAKKAKTT
jgi:hypothetical protein